MRRVRLVLGIVILVISLGILIWSVFPFDHVTRVLPIPPSELQLPTPEAMFLMGRFL